MGKKASPSLTLFASAINASAIGSAGFISVGLLPMIIKSFYTSFSQAGLTVLLYASGVTIGAPLLTISTGKRNRCSLMLGIMLPFTSGDLVTVFAPTLIILLVGRVLSALAHSIFMSVSTVIAADAVPSLRYASAIAIMFMGPMAATMTGILSGTFVRQQTTWRMSFLFITSAGLVGLIISYFLVPKSLPIPGKVDIKRVTRIFTSKPLVFFFSATASGHGGTFVACTYLSPLLENLGLSTNTVVIILVIYGVVIVIGNTVGGYWTNKKPPGSLVKMFSLSTLLLVFSFVIVLIDNNLLGLLASLMLGLFVFMNVPSLQLYIVGLAEKYALEDITLTSAFNIAAFNIGVIVGLMTGGAVTDHLSIAYTPISGGFITLITVLFVFYIQKQEKRKNNHL